MLLVERKFFVYTVIIEYYIGNGGIGLLNDEIKDIYTDILKEELIPAMGCTEPIAVAYAGALARQTLGEMPDSVELVVSGNIIKNVKSVIVPHTNGRKGLQTAVAVGICYGDADKVLEVIANVTDDRMTV